MASALDRISATGKPPPTSLKTGATRGGTKTGAGTSDIKAALMAELVQRMREKFSAFGTDVKTQETIASQVNKFMATSGSIHERDIATLEERIRNMLQGIPADMEHTRVPLKQPVVKDEWSKLTAFEAVQTKLEEQRKLEKLRETRKFMKSELDRQVAETEAKRVKEQELEDFYHQQAMADFKQWEDFEREKKEKQHTLMQKLIVARDAQLADQKRRSEKLKEAHQAEMDEMNATLKSEMERKLMDEQQKKEKAKEAMDKLKEANELTKKLQAEAAKKEQAEDLRYAQLQAEVLEKQEKQRANAVAARLKLQDNQLVAGSGRGPAKRFMPEEIIEKNFQEHEKALDAMEKMKKEKVVKGNMEMRAMLARQLEDKLKAKQLEEEMEADRVAKFKQSLLEAELKDEAKKEKIKHRDVLYKQELEDQMRSNANRTGGGPMSATEKALNRDYLKKVAEFTGDNTLV